MLNTSQRSGARFLPLLSLVTAIAFAQGSNPASEAPSHPEPTLVHLGASDMRMRDHDAFFATEDERIRTRRKAFGFPTSGQGRSPLTIGLAMSGGGIRSNAFHTGLLAGLHAEKLEGATLLDRIDYASSVSGGSWANVAMWAWPESLDRLYECLDAGASLGMAAALKQHPDCAEAMPMLRTTQRLALLAWPGRQRKESWRRAILKAHLIKGCDVMLDQPLPAECQQNVIRKPYFIINSTHSALSESPGIDGFPMETTFDAMATVIDDGSNLPGVPGGKGTAGFMLRYEGATYRWERRKFFSRWIPGGASGLKDGTQLSVVAAHSSAVIRGWGVPAMAFSFYFQLTPGPAAAPDAQLRAEYKLTDGGKSENTGLVPLVERNVDVIIASYMGKEDEKTPFGDFSNARRQTGKLFGCEFSAIDESASSKRLQTGTYTCPGNSTSVTGEVHHLHPWPTNIGEFIQSLESRAKAGELGLVKLVSYLKADRDRASRKANGNGFPQTPTFKSSYDEELVRAYYLLGEFCARNDLAPELRRIIRARE